MSSHRRGMRLGRGWWRSVWFVLPLLVAWAIPLVVIFAVAPALTQSEQESVESVVPDIVPVGSRSNNTSTPVTVVVGYGRSAQLTTRASGLVTDVSMTVGQKIKQCKRLFDVNGRPVLAYRASSPLYRDLSVKDEGDDVRDLARFLVACGVLEREPESDEFTAEMEAAVKRLHTDLLGGKAKGVFAVEDVVFVPREMPVVKSVSISVGQELAPSEPIALTIGHPESIAFVAPDTGEQLELDDVGKYTLTAGEAHVEFSGSGIESGQVDEFYSFLVGAVSTGTMTNYTTSDGETGAADQPASTESFNGATVALADASDIGAVPSTAVFVNDTGATCVFLPAGTSYEAYEIDEAVLIRGELGSIGVPKELIGNSVVRDPSVLSDEVRSTCA